MKKYIEEVKKRIDLLKSALDGPATPDGLSRTAFHIRNLLEYLEGLDYFAEEEKKHKFCAICGRPLWIKQDGSLTCNEIH